MRMLLNVIDYKKNLTGKLVEIQFELFITKIRKGSLTILEEDQGGVSYWLNHKPVFKTGKRKAKHKKYLI